MRDQQVRHLFVYGTLRHNSGHERAQWLGTIAKFKGAARLAGRLVDLGDYPGLLPPTNALQKVRGDLWELPEDGAILDVLDRYEGCHADDPDPHEYRRILCTATDGRCAPSLLGLAVSMAGQTPANHPGRGLALSGLTYRN